MIVIIILILASLAMALLFLGGFIWAVRSSQFEDTLTPSLRVLPDEDRATKPARSPVGFDPNGRDARATTAATDQGFKTRNLVWEKSLPVEKGRGEQEPHESERRGVQPAPGHTQK